MLSFKKDKGADLKKTIKFILSILAIVVAFIFLVILYINITYPNVSLKSDFKADITTESLKRGEYLVNSVSACFHCHSTVDFSKFSGKIIQSSIGKGGRFFSEESGFPGMFYTSNITPHNLKNWTDSEIYRAISSGVNKNGNALFPLMPYESYKYLTIDDAKAIVGYLRTITPIEVEYPKSDFSFPFSVILKTIPSEPCPTDKDSLTTEVEFGEYLVNIGGCHGCHTPTEGGSINENMILAGGFKIPMETGGTCISANITPDNETGIGSWTKEKFIQRFKSFQNIDSLNVLPGQFNTEMPWSIYANMTETDLGSIYEYLRTIKPVKNYVNKFVP